MSVNIYRTTTFDNLAASRYDSLVSPFPDVRPVRIKPDNLACQTRFGPSRSPAVPLFERETLPGVFRRKSTAPDR